MFEILFFAFIVIIGIQLFYYLILFGVFSFSQENKKSPGFNKPVSVIICCKNEAKNLEAHLPYFIDQNYNDFELVLINDRSSDNTLEIIERFKEKYSSLIKIVDVADNEQFWGSKKYALTLGIKAATHEHLLFTDADCKPNSSEWIQYMSADFADQKDIILGYGAYRKTKKSFLNKLIRYETLLTALQYFSYLNVGIPYMGVGRNMAYTKSFFFAVNGFASHMHVRSGDDDLFINQNANAKNTVQCVNHQSFTSSIPKMNWKSWIQQKRRHVSTASLYKGHHKLLLGLYYISQVFFWVLAVLLLALVYRPEIVIPLVFIRLVVSYMTIGFTARKLGEKDLTVWTPVLEILLIFIQMFIFIKNLTSKPSHW